MFCTMTAPLPVVGVRQRERLFSQRVEQHFFRADILGERMVIVQMVVRDIREHGPGEMQPFGAVLHEAVRADLHKAVLAPPIDHLGHHPVEPDAVGSRVRRLAPIGVDAVRHRRDQADLIAEAPEQAVQQRRGRRLAVGPRHADQPERPARSHRKRTPCVPRDRRVGDAQIGYSLGQPRGYRLADDRNGPRPDRRLDESMPVRLRASRSEKQRAGSHPPRVELERRDVRRTIARRLQYVRRFQKIVQ